MNHSNQTTPTLHARWYTVIEVWLIIVLLVASVAASLGLVATAIMRPDAHIVVPDDVPRPSHLPPIKPAGKRASPPS